MVFFSTQRSELCYGVSRWFCVPSGSCACGAGAVSATSYTFYDLIASGETTSRAYGINNNNVVVGYHQVTGTGYQTLVWNNGTKSYLAPSLAPRLLLGESTIAEC